MTSRKFWDIDYPPVAVLVGPRAFREPILRSLRTRDVDVHAVDVAEPSDPPGPCEFDAEIRVEILGTGTEALTRLDARPQVESLWFPETLPDTTGLDLASRARERDDVVGLALAPSTATSSALERERVAGAATAAGVTTYVPAAASPRVRTDRLLGDVVDALERRHDAEKRAVLDLLLSEFDISIYAKDEQARHVLLADVLGNYDIEEAFGKTDLELYPTTFEDVQNAYEDDRRVIETGEPVVDRLERQSHGTDYTWSLTTKVPWTNDDTTRGLVGISIDVSEFKCTERRLLQQIARLEQFPGYVSHDLKNPLQVAYGYLELAKAGDEEALERVHDALDRMEELIADFQSMALSEGENGRSQPLVLADLVDAAWNALSLPDATLERAFDPETTIVARDTQLRPLFENLFKNAAMHAGPDATVRVGVLDDGFYVEDDGPGIPVDERDDVFDYGYTTSSEGSGMGLSIVMETVMAHEWQCRVTDGSDGGARFEFRHCLVGAPLPVRPTGERFAFDASTDVGDPDVAGSARTDLATGRHHLTGGGENVWGETNEFHYQYASVDGGVRIEGRLADFAGPYAYSKAGLMVRSSLDPDAAYGFVGGTLEYGPEVLWRTVPGDLGYSAQFEHPESEYEWFRLDRVGDHLCAWVSPDGRSWEVADCRTVSLSDTIFVGLAVCSVSPGESCEATFEEVSLERLALDAAGD
ncbi:PAS domain-containing sensor histidine kinase [Natronobiforma cellulositropha]|uniref:PAS domain-containing sensor histidine kinase n=1 Tax=Natronobiforma cellulositropha TaxID=1679076 RepID=UPI0021D56B20|nr:PAS domain-containing sensor histidine kinase [Natronobiforma cellulositropha]